MHFAASLDFAVSHRGFRRAITKEQVLQPAVLADSLGMASKPCHGPEEKHLESAKPDGNHPKLRFRV